MVRYQWAITALLLCAMAGIAKAEDTPGPQSRDARKLLATLDKFGINSSEVRNLVGEIDTHMDDNRMLKLAGTGVPGGRLSFSYHVTDMPSTRQFELRYTPDDSHVSVVARSNIIEIGYHLRF